MGTERELPVTDAARLPGALGGRDAPTTCSSQRRHTVSSERQARALSWGTAESCLPGKGSFHRRERHLSAPLLSSSPLPSSRVPA